MATRRARAPLSFSRPLPRAPRAAGWNLRCYCGCNRAGKSGSSRACTKSSTSWWGLFPCLGNTCRGRDTSTSLVLSLSAWPIPASREFVRPCLACSTRRGAKPNALHLDFAGAFARGRRSLLPHNMLHMQLYGRSRDMSFQPDSM